MAGKYIINYVCWYRIILAISKTTTNELLCAQKEQNEAERTIKDILINTKQNTNTKCFILSRAYINKTGADPGFQVRGAHLKKLRRAEGGTKNFGVFRVKNHDFTPKNHIFPILGGAREIFGVFHVKNHDFTPKKSYFYQF